MTEEAIPEHGEAASQCDTSATQCDSYRMKLISDRRSPVCNPPSSLVDMLFAEAKIVAPTASN